jgi:hypothetical protein
MCDFSLHAVRSRPAKVGDKLTTRLFNTGTRGFSAPEDEGMAVCLLPGTELSFADEVKRSSPWPWTERIIGCKTAIFRQINKANRHTHHDALEFPNGQLVLLTIPGRRTAGHRPSIAHDYRREGLQGRRASV